MNSSLRIFTIIFASLLTLTAGARPLIIGHRGDSGHFPEHTWAGYMSALKKGADYIELDVVMDKEGELWIRHEAELTASTNAKELFPKRMREVIFAGKKIKGIFASDLSTAEMSRIGTKQRFSFRDQKLNSRETLLSVKQLVELLGTYPEIRTGLYIETKHADYYFAQGFRFEEKLVQELRPLLSRGGYPIIFQSDSLDSLKRLQKIAPAIPRTLLVSKKEKIDWNAISGVVTILGLHKELIVPFSMITRLPGRPTQIVAEAHRRGYLVHAWTLRNEWWFRHFSTRGPESEYLELRRLGVDGVFSDFPETAAAAWQTR